MSVSRGEDEQRREMGADDELRGKQESKMDHRVTDSPDHETYNAKFTPLGDDTRYFCRL